MLGLENPAASPGRAVETADRVVASIGNNAITQSDVEAEYRLELFLGGKPAQDIPDLQTFDRVRDRLIEQRLLAEEAAAEGLEVSKPLPSAAEVTEELRQKFGTDAAFRSALASLGMDEHQLARRITEQQQILRLIDQHFRLSASPEPSEIEAYYRREFLPQFSSGSGAAPPPLATVGNQIREILTQKKINELLAAWLGEMKSNRRARVHAF